MRTLDELTIPPPPYRSARPVASLAAQSFNDGLKQQMEKALGVQASPEIISKPETTLEDSARKEVAEAKAIRNSALESKDVVLILAGGKLLEAISAVEQKLTEAAAPVVQSTPETPAAVIEKPVGYEVPKQVQSELDAMTARQADLRAKGDEAGAKLLDARLGKYREWIRQERAKFDTEQKNAEVNHLFDELNTLSQSAVGDTRKALELANDRNSSEAPTKFRDARDENLESYREIEARIQNLMRQLNPAEQKSFQEKLANARSVLDQDARSRNLRRDYRRGVNQAHDEAMAENVSRTNTPIQPDAPVTESNMADLQAEPVAPLQSEPAPQLQAESIPEIQEEREPQVVLENLEQERESLRRAMAGMTGNELARAQRQLDQYNESIAQQGATREAATEAEITVDEDELLGVPAASPMDLPQSPSERLGENGAGVQLTPEQQEMLRNAATAPAPEDLPMRPVEQQAAASEQSGIEEDLPLQPENPSREIREMRARRKEQQPGGILSSAAEWVSRKTGAGAWLDTLMPRLKSVYHRQFAESRAVQQEKAMGSLERAKEKAEDYKAKVEGSSWGVFKSFYSWRARAWDKTVAKREGLVNRYDVFRKKRIERHNELQNQVSARYERELAPYRGKQEALAKTEALVKKVMTALEKDKKNALDQLKIAEGKRKGLWGRRGKTAADKIRRQVDEITRRLDAQRKSLERVQKPLAEATAKIEKYESKQKQVKANMDFSGMDDLQGIQHESPVSLPRRNNLPTYGVEAPRAAARESAGERDGEVWTAGEFIQSWNMGGPEALIQDSQEFEEFIASNREGSGETGPLQLGKLLKLTEEYLKANGQKKGFAKDKRHFLAHTPKKITSNA